MKTIRLTSGFRWASIYAMLMLSAVLQGCGGGSSAPPPPAGINAGSDYYDSLSGGGGQIYSDTSNTTLVNISDLQAIIKGDQLMLVSVSENVAWFAKINTLTNGSYTADVNIYKDNNPIGTATLSGTITSGTSITGTLTGAGIAYGNGTFSLDVSAENTTKADLATIVHTVTSWKNVTNASFSIFYIDSTGNVTNQNFGSYVGNFLGCHISGTATVVANSALYQFQITLSNCDTTVAAANGTYSGFVTTRSASATNDTLVVALENSTNGYSMYGEFQ